mgnify:FL=1
MAPRPHRPLHEGPRCTMPNTQNLGSCAKSHCCDVSCTMREMCCNPSVQKIKGSVENVTERTYNVFKEK